MLQIIRPKYDRHLGVRGSLRARSIRFRDVLVFLEKAACTQPIKKRYQSLGRKVHYKSIFQMKGHFVAHFLPILLLLQSSSGH